MLYNLNSFASAYYFKSNYFQKFNLPPLPAAAKVGPNPPTLTSARIMAANPPVAMATVCIVSVHITAFMPPYIKKKQKNNNSGNNQKVFERKTY